MNCKLSCALVIGMCLAGSIASADTLELKNGSVIEGKFLAGTETAITFQVASSVEKFNLVDIASVKFDSDRTADNVPSPQGGSLPYEPGTSDPDRGGPNVPAYVTVPAGTRISVRTIDGIDSRENHPGDRFKASLEEALVVNGAIVVPKGADIYGRLAESKKSGTFTGKSELQLELTGIVVNGQTVPLVTGEYELTGKSKGASTAKRTIGGAALGGIIGALAGGGKGAAIGAGVGGGVGAGSEIITKGDQVKVPSETLLDFTLEQDVSIPARRS